MIVDELHDVMPELMQDPHWGDLDVRIPYTEESKKFQKRQLVGSAKSLKYIFNLCLCLLGL